MGRGKVKKILYDKYVPMLTIRDGHVDNHFSDKFVFLYHVDYFINSDGGKLTVRYICYTFYTFETKFCIFIFQEHICQQITHLGTKVIIYPILIFFLNHLRTRGKIWRVNIIQCLKSFILHDVVGTFKVALD